MICYMIAVALLCWINFVNCLVPRPPSPACISAKQALATNTACQTAFGSIATATSDSLLCSGGCRSLIEDVLNNCPNQAGARNLLVAACEAAIDTDDVPAAANLNACRDATQALANNTVCQESFNTVSNSSADNSACSWACRRLIDDYLDRCFLPAENFRLACGGDSRGGAGTVKGYGILALLLATVSAVSF